ncbi:N-acetyltransferase [Ectobacillus antri]|jgi:predicted N-acetyltransferase YhbS|uniref:N-acetyltransferase n=1 Tax=Ectobacillus antri TaxID=2486280 RepID=A0ABT6H9V4_9BACI|nr:N-acetyltransferase [Ectobacillus antri]MDG4658313.1 N-acetyltransferase [Ectobacillus antri]MDG5755598.1 N-acetyltransferase [Ectobacillus antri]
MITIRQETSADHVLTEQVVRSAFANAPYSDQSEHALVERLRKSDAFIPELSLVATDDEQIIGHILLTRAAIINEEKQTETLALAPVSVLPAFQGQGVGKKLIAKALEIAAQLGYHSVIVLGHSEYYPKFGFKRASTWNIKAPFDVPDEVFMALELEKDALSGVSGTVSYASAFFE